MRKSHKRSRAPVSIVAAIVLIIQAFLGGTWMGAQAATGPRDAFGNVLCVATHAGGTSQHLPHGGGYDCDCCLSGCHVGAGIVLDASNVEPISVVYFLVASGKRLVDTPIRRQELQPLSSRAPPA